MNYTELTALIEAYTENTETSFVANIPNFVKLAEERIYRHIKLPKLRKVNTALVTVAGTNTVTAPSDFLSVDSLTIISAGVHTHLIPKESDFIREAYGTVATQGKPVYYALRDHTTLLLGPTPDAIYTFELLYTHKPASIVTDGTSWVGDNAENALLYGSLFEAYTYMKGEADLLQLYNMRFQEALGLTKLLGETKDRTDEWRNSPPRGAAS